MAREVDRVAALVGLAVQRVAGADVVAHVGDRDPELEAAAHALAVHRVVEVLRGLAVDGDERELAQVPAALEVLRGHRLRELARGLERLARPFVRQVVLAQRDLDLHPGIGVVAEHLDDAADGLGVLGRLLHDLGHHDLAFLHALEALRRDEDVLVDALVLGDHESHAVLDEDAAHDPRVGALEHLDDVALEAAASIHAGHAHQHRVAVQRLVHLLGAEEEVVAAVVGPEEAEAVGVAHDLALDEARLVRQQQGAAPVAHHLALALHGGDAPLDAFALGGAVHAEPLDELVFGHGNACLGEGFEHLLAAGNLGGISLQVLGFDGQSC